MNSTLEVWIGFTIFIWMIFGCMLSNYSFKKEFTRRWIPIFRVIFFGMGAPFVVIRILRMVGLEEGQFTPYILIASGIIGSAFAYARGKDLAKEMYENWNDPFYRNRKWW